MLGGFRGRCPGDGERMHQTCLGSGVDRVEGEELTVCVCVRVCVCVCVCACVYACTCLCIGM